MAECFCSGTTPLECPRSNLLEQWWPFDQRGPSLGSVELQGWKQNEKAYPLRAEWSSKRKGPVTKWQPMANFVGHFVPLDFLSVPPRECIRLRERSELTAQGRTHRSMAVMLCAECWYESINSYRWLFQHFRLNVMVDRKQQPLAFLTVQAVLEFPCFRLLFLASFFAIFGSA